MGLLYIEWAKKAIPPGKKDKKARPGGHGVRVIAAVRDRIIPIYGKPGSTAETYAQSNSDYYEFMPE